MKVKGNKQVQSRKQRRKECRLAKKAKKHEFFSKKKLKGLGNKANKNVNVKKYSGNDILTEDISKVSKKKKNKLAQLGKTSSLQDEFRRELLEDEKKKKDLDKQMAKVRKRKLMEDNSVEDREIHRMEKNLKLKKRSDKSISKFFAQDGLDYLLEVCDEKRIKDVAEAEKNFKDESCDFGDDLAEVMGNLRQKKSDETSSDSDEAPDEMPSKKVRSKTLLKVTEPNSELDEKDKPEEDSGSDFEDDNFSQSDLSNDDDEESDSTNDFDEESKTDKQSKKQKAVANANDQRPRSLIVKKAAKTSDKNLAKPVKQSVKRSQDEFIQNPFSDDEVSSLGVESDEEDPSNEEKQNDDGVWEDIYGRTRDKQGNVLTAYQPPQMRKTAEENSSNSEKNMRLRKQLKGLLNRLAENNITSISSQIESLYMSHSRNEMNETLWSLISESLISETMSPERLVAEHAMLIAVLGANVGGEISAYCLQKCVTEWHKLWQVGPVIEDKKTNNVLFLLSYMYHFKIFHCILLYDILEVLIQKIDEKEVELILLVLRTVGFTLRKDDPARLKEFVLKAQALANSKQASGDGTRARFMMDTILAIKNNNVNKIPNYDPEYGERIKKILKACIRKGNYNAELKITLEDLLKADERGRWWIVGSAWTGQLPGEKEPEALTPAERPTKKAEEGFSSKLLELARKQRMNTDTRRTVFCIIMSAEDYLDAFEKLLKLGLKGPAEREIMNVLLHCLLSEKQYNPYYSHLARRFCQCNRRFQIMLQFAVWDKMQDLKSLSSTNISNLSKFLGFLILEKSLALSVLKVIHFAELDKQSVRFIRQVILTILLTESEETMMAAFARISSSKPLKLFREGLRLFLHHFVLRNTKAMEGTDMTLLTSRVKHAESALTAGDRSYGID